MSAPFVPADAPNPWSIWKRWLAVCTAFALIFAAVVGGLYWQDRGREWILRVEQSQHRLDVAVELISREVARVRSDALFLADQDAARRFASGDEGLRESLETEYKSFVRRKTTYDQIRLLSLDGEETIRVNFADGRATAIPQSELQDKEDRYYYREAVALGPGQVFVSEFDLNLEHGAIERPLKPVIRCVTPLDLGEGQSCGFLVLNYLGARLLEELDNSSVPGATLLVRADGHYLRGPRADDTWGWLLGHDRKFTTQFSGEWEHVTAATGQCRLFASGALASRLVWLGNVDQPPDAETPESSGLRRDAILVVSYLPRAEVFAASTKLLWRLLALAACMVVPLALLARYWAHASVSRQWQSQRIAASEERLRELSSRLLRLQEDERRAISREIHDDLGQQVTAISLDLKLADRSLDGQSNPHLARAIAENAELLQTLHAFATRVRPAVLDDLGLLDAVESHLWDFEKRTGVAVDSRLAFPAGEIPAQIADNAYRLLQEALNNVAKHADAKRVRVEMHVEHQDDGKHLSMLIHDDGRGYDETADGDGKRLGLVGMRERVDLLDGRLRIESSAERGTSISVVLPLRKSIVEPVVEHSA